MAPDDRHDGGDELVDGLYQQARVLVQARRLPMHALTDELIDQIRLDLTNYMRSNDLRHADVANELGYSPSTLSQFLNGLYQGSNENLARTTNDWMERHARRQAAALPENFIDTKIAGEMHSLIDAAMTTNSILVIVAPSGSGKSLVLDVESTKQRGPMITALADDTPRTFLGKLSRKIGVTTAGSTAELHERVIAKLTGTNRALFVDEAQLLKPSILTRLRSIHDLSSIPIVLAGTSEILASIDDRRDGKGQLASRCIQYNVMERVIHADSPSGQAKGRPLFSREEVAEFLAGLDVKLDGDALELCWSLACLPNRGCLRTLYKVVHHLKHSSRRRDEPLTRKRIIYALKFLFGLDGGVVVRHAKRQHAMIAESAA